MGWRQVFLIKKQLKPYFFGHYNSWNLDKSDDTSSDLFSKKISVNDCKQKN
jgi:hypothetical protein